MSGKTIFDGMMTRAETAVSKGQQPVAVFDLDGTLFDNGPRTLSILAEFANETDNEALAAALRTREGKPTPYLLADLFHEMGETNEELIKAASDFWFKRFFTNDYQAYDKVMPGAVSFVNDFYRSGGTVVYLTGRDAPNMVIGCVAALQKGGFPIGVTRTSLVLKPDFDTADLAFKREAVNFIEHLGEVVVSLDNEPGNCNLFLESWPNALIGFIDTQCAPGAPKLLEGIETFKDFLRQ